MKKILLSLLALTLYFYSLGQDRKFEVICEVYRRGISYADMDKILPDSVQGYFVKLSKKGVLSDLAIVNTLCVNGWTLVNHGDRKGYASTSSPAYVLKREFWFAEQDYQVILKRVNERMTK